MSTTTIEDLSRKAQRQRDRARTAAQLSDDQLDDTLKSGRGWRRSAVPVATVLPFVGGAFYIHGRRKQRAEMVQDMGLSKDQAKEVQRTGRGSRLLAVGAFVGLATASVGASGVVAAGLLVAAPVAGYLAWRRGRGKQREALRENVTQNAGFTPDELAAQQAQQVDVQAIPRRTARDMGGPVQQRRAGQRVGA